MQTPMTFWLIALAAACYLLPFATEARTGILHPRQYYIERGDDLAACKLFILRRYIPLQLMNSTVMATGAIFLFFNFSNGVNIIGAIGIVLLIVSLCFGILLITWPGWVLLKNNRR